tara:strand:+ start:282 stop:1631 length:1350 start_codon:yes stop_codon:yes gene_type:complete
MVRIKQEQNQKQVLTPQQILQANLFQLNSADLEQRILKELEENPALDLIENDDISNEDKDNQNDEFDWDEESIENFDNAESDKPYNKLNHEIPIKEDSNFIDSLNNQIKDLNLSAIELDVAEQIIGNIDEDGYLTIETILISDRLNIDESIVLKILKLIQKLDPPGIGSRNLKECLLSQVEEKKVDPIVWDILSNHFEDFANHRYNKILKSLNCSEDELKNSMDTISTLNPKPGMGLSNSNNLIIIPDIIMEYFDDRWNITINDSSLPELKISSDYEKLLLKHKDKKVKTFVQNKLDSAHWFIDALKQRNQTLFLIMNSIIKRQPDFFKKNKKLLKPMILKDVAKDINMDISTISRMTNSKYVQLPYGIFELKYFFSEGIETGSGEMVSNKTVKELLKEIIKKEDKKHPFGDEKLANLLNEKGYKIARRTVTKYRESLKIPVGRLRKEI